MSNVPNVSAAFSDVATRFPWLRELLYRASFVATERVPTAAIDKRLRVVINPSWFGSLSHEHRAGVLAHEIFHALLGHHDRFPVSDYVNGLAVDAETNASLRKANQSLPDGAVYPEQFDCSDDMTAEEIANRIRKLQQRNPNLQRNGDVVSVGSCTDCETSDRPSKNAKSTSKKKKKEQRLGNSKICSRGVHGDGPWTEDAEKAPGVDPVAVEKARREVLEAVLQAIESGSISIGSIPGSVLREARRLRTPVPWQRVLAGAVASAVGRHRNGWAVRKPHPVVGGRIAIPTLARTRALRVVVIGDTSGSMTEAMLGRVVDVVLGAADRAEVLFIPVDAEAHGVQKIVRGRPIKLIGGGGTDFRPAFEIAEKLKASAIVIVTDTYGEWPDSQPAAPVWLVPTCREMSSDTPAWCRVVKVDLEKEK